VEFFIGRNDAPQEFSLTDFMLDASERVDGATMGNRLDSIDPEVLMKSNPEYYGPRFEAMAEERKRDDGSMKGMEFRKVASFTNVPLFEALRIRDGLLRGKKEFYAMLKKYPQCKAYDRRGKDHPTETFVNGVPA
jgi:hypothetical protein